MNYGGDAAEQVVRMTLNGVEVAAKLTGKGAERLVMLIYSILKGQKRTKGKARLTSLLKSGKPLTIFAVPDERLAKFCQEAKKYGILYCVLKDNKANDGKTDIMVKEDDRAKVNRIFERFGLATVDLGSVQTEIEQDRADRAQADAIEPPERAMTHQEKVEAFLDEILKPNPTKEEQQTENPTEGRIARSRQSEPSSEKKSPTARDDSDLSERRPSVKKQLEEIRREQRKTAEAAGQRERLQEHIPPRITRNRHHKEERS